MTTRNPWDIALDKAKIQLMGTEDSVFFTVLCFSLKHVFRDDLPTAATDGRTVFYNPKFFMGLSQEERVFVLLHETLHCAYLHMLRIKQLNLNPRKANIAADHVINLMLIERGFKMPQGGLADPKYSGMSMEEVYKLLPEDLPPPPMDDLMEPDMGNEGGASDKPGSGTGASDLERDMQDTLVRARLQSKMAGDKPGSIPGDIEIFLNKLLNPKLPWTVILQRYIRTFSKNDYSWKKPNRRFFPDHHLPSMYSHSLIELAVAVDTSGSVTDEQSTQFVSEITSIFKMMKPPKITLLQFDTTIKSVDQLSSLQELSRVKFTGRGGTRIGPVIEWANTNKPQLLLVFTDGGFRFYGDETQVPLIWLIHDNPQWTAPYGKVIHYEI